MLAFCSLIAIPIDQVRVLLKYKANFIKLFYSANTRFDHI